MMNSQSFYLLVKMLVARVSLAQSFEAGLIQSIPIPNLSNADKERLCRLASAFLGLKRSLDSSNECSHGFRLSALLQLQGETLFERITALQKQVDEIQYQLAKNQSEIDAIAFDLYGIKEADLQVFEESVESGRSEAGVIDQETLEEDREDISKLVNAHELIFDLMSYIIGCSFGRWDVRFATGERKPPELPDPFAPLPVCSPGMHTGDYGLSLHETPAEYPLKINWEGILVDDADHLEDIIRRGQEVLRFIWQENAESIEQEVRQILGIKDLQEYFRQPGNGGFWMDHAKRYSKSRRKAPIYWLLQSSKRNYALWLYYHRLDKDTLFKALTIYVEPKLRLEEGRLGQLRTQLAGVGSTGREVKQLEKQLEHQESLMAELYDFRDKLRRAADLNLEPDLNDGVVLNIAPLWELVPWNEARKYWEELKAGKYEWSSISKQLRERKLI